MRALDKKLVRDLRRLWAQALAAALVMACGVATLILATGAYRSLEETRAAYYERYRFGDVFAQATRVPNHLRSELAAIPGIAALETRIERRVILDLLGMREPATGLVLSLPAGREPTVNALYLRGGRLPDPQRGGEVAVNENFAKAHGFVPGDRFAAVVNGKRLELTIVGVVLSPEHVYSLGPGDMMPDDRRFGVLWMAEEPLARLFDLEGAFDSVSFRLLPGASATAVIEAVDNLLKPYGGGNAIARKDQLSNAFLDAELTQLSGMAKLLPPVFLLVSAFLINMILSRLIALEREQIGLLKALGFGRAAVGWHYGKLVLAIAAVGIGIGFGAGTWLARGLTQLYSQFYAFPFLLYRYEPDVYAIAGLISLAAAIAGSARAIAAAFRLPAAEAMRPPAPIAYRRLLSGALARFAPFSRLTTMGLRHVARHPLRSGLTMIGTSFAVGLMTVSLGGQDSLVHMLDIIFHQTDRQDVSVLFASPQPASAIHGLERLPGIVAAEPFLSKAVRFTNGQYSRQLQITGKPPETDLSRVLDEDGHPVVLPPSGIALTERLASILRLRTGDLVTVEFLDGQRRTAEARVSQIVQGYVGLMAFMDIEALSRLAGTAPMISGAHLAADAHRIDDLYRMVKQLPRIAGVVLQDVSRDRFQATMQQNMLMSLIIYTVLAVIIAFGIVYNSARIQLSERARELATLRVIGFGRGEVWWVLIVELLLVVVLAQPVGWAIGYGLGVLMLASLASDLFRVPLAMEPSTFAISTIVVVGAAIASALIVRHRIDRLNLVQVLKTRE